MLRFMVITFAYRSALRLVAACDCITAFAQRPRWFSKSNDNKEPFRRFGGTTFLHRTFRKTATEDSVRR